MNITVAKKQTTGLDYNIQYDLNNMRQ